MNSKTLYEKLWQRHIIDEKSDGSGLLYIDRHLVHEVTSPQAFQGMRIQKRPIWNARSMLAVPDHNVPTINRETIQDEISRIQIEELDKNCHEFNVEQIPLNDKKQGIVHVIGPEQGLILPGLTVVCGDSHTSTHGAFGCLAFGVGTSEIEHVMATQCLCIKRYKTMRININGELKNNVFAKDVILFIIRSIGISGGNGYVLEYAGDTIQSMDMSGRMTICNMSIEAGARAGMIAVDDNTINFIKNRPMAPKNKLWEQASEYWKTLKSDSNAIFDKEKFISAKSIKLRYHGGHVRI